MTYPERMRKLREEWGGACVMRFLEGCDGQLEFAHVPGRPTSLSRGARGRGMPQRYHDVRNHPHSYVLVCAGHHYALDGRRTA